MGRRDGLDDVGGLRVLFGGDYCHESSEQLFWYQANPAEGGVLHNKAFANRVKDDFSGVVEIQLLHQVGSMSFDRRQTKIQK